jgi:hypothetical protein
VNISGVRNAVGRIWLVGGENAVCEGEYRTCASSSNDRHCRLIRSSKSAIGNEHSIVSSKQECSTGAMCVFEYVAVIHNGGSRSHRMHDCFGRTLPNGAECEHPSATIAASLVICH